MKKETIYRRLARAFMPSAAVCVIMAINACSDVDENERFEYVKPAEVSRAVLIEDFTGQQCANCPTASEEIDMLQELYGDTAVIAVGIHSGPLGFSGNSRYTGLKTTLGDTYYYYWGVEYQPQGMVNRQGLSDYVEWASLVYNALQETAPLDMELTSTYDEATRDVGIDVSLYGTDGNTSGYLQLWLVEDNITAIQILPDGSYDYEYVHNHVLREAVNGDWGEAVSVTEGETLTLDGSVTLDDDYVAENVCIVAFVYNDDGVQQVVKASVTDNE